MKLSKLAMMGLLSGMGLLAAPASLPLYTKEAQKPVVLQQSQGMKATLKQGLLADGEPAQVLAFEKKGQERRFLGLKIAVDGIEPTWRSLSMLTHVRGGETVSMYPVLYVVEKGGSIWLRQGLKLESGDNGKIYLGLEAAKFRQLSFCHDENGKLDCADVREIWVGVLVDGAGQGEVSLGQIVLSEDRFVPSTPLNVPIGKAKAWSKSADPAAKTTIEDAKDGEDPVIKMSFTFPLGHHMYFTPKKQLQSIDFASYSGIRITYKATIPRPIDGLLVFLSEHGSFVAGTPKPSADWTTVEMRFEDFKNVPWGKKAGDPKLSIAEIDGICIGCHGVAQKDDGKGEIWIKKLELIP